MAMERCRRWLFALVPLVLAHLTLVHAEFVHVRDISTLCGKKSPAPYVVGGSAASMVLRRKPGAYQNPCYVKQAVETDAGYIREGARLYVKVIQMAIQQNVDGSCYHSLTIQGGTNQDLHAQLCGPLANLTQNEFVTEDYQLAVIWDTREVSDPELSQLSQEHSYFKVVITAFEKVDPRTKRCPSAEDNDRPETLIKWHKCTNARCIDTRLRCNGFNNCGDWDASDEIGCPKPAEDAALWPIILGIIVGGLSLLSIIGAAIYRLGGSDDSEEEQEHLEE